MATVRIDARKIEDFLGEILETVRDEIDWVKLKKGDITLDVPEPYDHILRGPLAGLSSCNQLDVCGDVGILVAVYKAMHPKKPIKVSGPRKRGPRRK